MKWAGPVTVLAFMAISAGAWRIACAYLDWDMARMVRRLEALDAKIAGSDDLGPGAMGPERRNGGVMK